jgi:hypothetical protein
MKIFLAFSFRPEDKGQVSYIEQLLASQVIPIITGDAAHYAIQTPMGGQGNDCRTESERSN